MTTVLLIVIAFSLVVIAAALAYTVSVAYRLYRQVQQIQEVVDPHIAEFNRKQAIALETMDRIQTRQAEMTEGMQRASAATAKLGYLLDEFGLARDRLRGR